MTAHHQTPSDQDAGCRNLVVVLGDQLDAGSAAFDGFDRGRDLVWMAETVGEAEAVWSSKARLVMFFSAMRHFRQRLEEQGFPLTYRRLDDPANRGGLGAELAEAIRARRPEKLIVVQPGEHRIFAMLERTSRAAAVPLEIRPDRSFFCTPERFDRYASSRKQLRMEYFYRAMRREAGLLMDEGKPAGGRWNYDADNRLSFGVGGPPPISPPRSFAPDAITREVMALVNERFADHPGRCDRFDYPVTADQAAEALEDFIAHRLAGFGPHEDAMWTGEPVLLHSRLSAALNLKLLSPRAAVEAAERAFRRRKAPLGSVEGFVRQILGWREYVRGVYWRFMPDYLQRNALAADRPLPGFYWTGQTEARCLREVVGQTLELGYAHHIQRLMVTGLFALLAGVDPRQAHQWYLAVYVDAVEWVELPNTLGMSQFADGGVMASKPYCATGRYIQRMSNYCRDCRFRPDRATGEDACPFTALYWRFLMRHEKDFAAQPRMRLQVRNLDRLDRREKAARLQTAERILAGL